MICSYCGHVVELSNPPTDLMCASCGAYWRVCRDHNSEGSFEQGGQIAGLCSNCQGYGGWWTLKPEIRKELK